MEQSLKPLRYPLAALALTMLAACDRAPVAANAPGAPHVTVAKVIEQPITEWDEVTARLEAPETVEVRPRVSGITGPGSYGPHAWNEVRLADQGGAWIPLDATWASSGDWFNPDGFASTHIREA